MSKPKQNKETQRAQRQERFLDEYARVGTISAGARAARVDRRTAKRWIDSDAAFRQRFREARAVFEDSIRERLMDRAETGNGATLRFIAKGELPEQYGDASRRRPAKPAEDIDAMWEELEQAIEDSDREDTETSRRDPPGGAFRGSSGSASTTADDAGP
ncbi:MAG: hypothetical protein V3V35_10630 [Dehalococcoidia bacterium]